MLQIKQPKMQKNVTPEKCTLPTLPKESNGQSAVRYSIFPKFFPTDLPAENIEFVFLNI